MSRGKTTGRNKKNDKPNQFCNQFLIFFCLMLISLVVVVVVLVIPSSIIGYEKWIFRIEYRIWKSRYYVKQTFVICLFSLFVCLTNKYPQNKENGNENGWLFIVITSDKQTNKSKKSKSWLISQKWNEKQTNIIYIVDNDGKG